MLPLEARPWVDSDVREGLVTSPAVVMLPLGPKDVPCVPDVGAGEKSPAAARRVPLFCIKTEDTIRSNGQENSGASDTVSSVISLSCNQPYMQYTCRLLLFCAYSAAWGPADGEVWNERDIFSSLRITSSARNSAVPDSTEGSALNFE